MLRILNETKEYMLINLDPTIGAETKKKKPCVILNDDAIGVLPLKVFAPITDFKENIEKYPGWSNFILTVPIN